jgi:hypothetical protein
VLVFAVVEPVGFILNLARSLEYITSNKQTVSQFCKSKFSSWSLAIVTVLIFHFLH